MVHWAKDGLTMRLTWLWGNSCWDCIKYCSNHECIGGEAIWTFFWEVKHEIPAIDKGCWSQYFWGWCETDAWTSC